MLMFFVLCAPIVMVFVPFYFDCFFYFLPISSHAACRESFDASSVFWGKPVSYRMQILSV